MNSNHTIARLKCPDALMRPAPFWSWNDKLDEQELRRQIREMADKGWGSFFMHSRVGLVTGYLSEDWMRLVNACCEEAENVGVRAWLYDEDKWPSGFAGGEVPAKDKSYRAQKLVLLHKGAVTENDTALTSITSGGVEYEICRRIAPLGNTWFNNTSYVDLMNPDAVREFINCTHERYKLSCGKHFGKAIPGIFTDEPCYFIDDNNDIPAVPWSEHFRAFFLETKGYDVLDNLPQMFFDEGDYRKVRFDFYDTATELFKRSFTKQYYDWCETNSLLMTGHFMSEDTMCFQTLSSGDVMSHYEFMHWPGIDKLRRDIDNIVTIKQLTSVVEQLGKDRAFSETYGCVGGQVSFFHRKWIGDWQAALGISFINHHLSLYSMRGERKRDYPANFFYQQPWWNDERALADYQARLCAAVSCGGREVNLLVIQPLTSVWSEYSPLHKEIGYPFERAYDDSFAMLSRRLMEEKLDYHYGNENIMANHGSVADGRIVVGIYSYNCVVVPPISNLKASTLGLLQEFSRQGGKVIFVRSLPCMIDGAKSNVDLPEAEVLPSIEECVNALNTLCKDRVEVIDLLTGANAVSVYVHSRNVGASKWYLLTNTDEKREVKAKIRLPNAERNVAVFDLWDGALYKLPAGDIDLTFAPAGSLLLICGEEAGEGETTIPQRLGSGVSFADMSGVIPVCVVDELDCEVMEPNVLVLNDFVLEMNGERVCEGPVCGAWHKYFYPAAEGTPFAATYSFYSECELEGCFTAIEVAENLNSISFNGCDVKPLKTAGESGQLDPGKSWKDINFTKVPLPQIEKGTNALIIKGVKSNNITGPGCHDRVPNWRDHQPTEAEEVYVCGDFSLKKLSDSRYAVSHPCKPGGRNLTTEGFPFYCGRAAYTSTFYLERPDGRRVTVALNGAHFASARILVNGADCGLLMWEPYMLDITSRVVSGENSLDIEISTTLVNSFGPNRTARVKDSVLIGPDTFVNMSAFKSGYELFDLGIESISVYLIRY